MSELDLLPSLAIILVLGVGARWLAVQLRLPSILLLLITGMLVGPVASLVSGRPLIEPGRLFGEALLPLVSLSVAVILYEGGLTLRLAEMREWGHVVRNIVTAGAIVTWLASTGVIYALGLLPLSISLLFGAILTVTGPTVVGPLLRNLRLRGPAAPILKWEGIVIDPIGATLAVLVFETLLPGRTAGPGHAVVGFLRTAVVGGGLGLAAAALLAYPLRRHWIPDSLENGVSLALMAATFVLSNALQHESGLLAVTVMGLTVTNTVKEQHVRDILAFKENLRDLLLPGLFVVLGATLQVDDLRLVLGWRLAVFLALLVLAIRPLSVFVATLGSKLEWRERLMLCCVAPRGIVAAAVASIFSLALVEAGRTEAQTLPALTFAVIIVTVSCYSLLARLVAPRLGLSVVDPQGVLILGASDWTRALGRALQAEGVPVLLIDGNFSHVTEAKLDGLPAAHANVLSDHAFSELALGELGRLLALTPNDEVNSLAAERFGHVFGRAQVYQLSPKADRAARHTPTHKHPVRYLFAPDESYERIADRYRAGCRIKTTQLTEEFSLADWDRLYTASTKLALLVRRGEGPPLVRLFTVGHKPLGGSGDRLVALIDPADSKAVGEKKASRRLARKARNSSGALPAQEPADRTEPPA